MIGPKRLPYVVALAGATVFAAGFFIPQAKYIPTRAACPDGKPPEVRLHMVMGDRIENFYDKKQDAPNPLEECSQQVKYVLYFF